MRDDELERWRVEWQALGGKDVLAKELAARAVRDERRLRRAVWIEIVAAMFATLPSGFLLVRTHGEIVVVAVSLAITVFCGVWITRLLTLHEGSLRLRREVPAANAPLERYVVSTRDRLERELRWNAFARRAMSVLGVLLVPWSVWTFVHREAMYRAEPWRAVAGFGGAAVIFAGVFIAQVHKRKKLVAERRAFEALVAERTMA